VFGIEFKKSQLLIIEASFFSLSAAGTLEL
jgi:hypothetical protein